MTIDINLLVLVVLAILVVAVLGGFHPRGRRFYRHHYGRARSYYNRYSSRRRY